MTDSNGEAVVRGLDSTYIDYYFEEVVAPNGYSINDDDSIVRWGANQTADATTGTASMSDTKAFRSSSNWWYRYYYLHNRWLWYHDRSSRFILR